MGTFSCRPPLWPSAAENLETFDVTKLGIFKINIIRSIDLNVRVALIKC